MKTPPVPPGCDPDSIVLSFAVAREHEGLRLDRFIHARIPRLSRTRANRVVRTCAHHPNGSRRKPSERVRAGEIVLLVRDAMDEAPAPDYFDVVYEDRHVFVVDKPPGLSMHPTASSYRHTLSYLFMKAYPNREPQFAHRLDKETSGLVVCGWGTANETFLKKAFQAREAKKTYLAIVEGEMAARTGRMDMPLGRKRDGLQVMMEVQEEGEGLHALTYFEVVDRAPNATLVKLFPHTGRQHQLRVHLAAIGHPIIGDKLYGPEGPTPFLLYVERDRSMELLTRLTHPRHALHAHSLRIAHPGTHEEMEVTVDLAWDLKLLWAHRKSGRTDVCVDFDALLKRPGPDSSC